MIADILYDLDYLPKPNYVEVVLTDTLAPAELTGTAFVFPVCDDGAVVMAVNLLRGIEAAGGHVEPGETVEAAVRREALEEVGCTVGKLTPVGYLRQEVLAPRPEVYRYPHPISYQQFFAAPLIRQDQHTALEECAAAMRISVLAKIPSKTTRLFAARALLLLEKG